MSGIIGHTLYAILAKQAAEKRQLPVARIAQQNLASYLAGAYIGCDIQVMPEAICVDTGKEVGFGTVPVERSPLTGGPVRQFYLRTPEGEFTPRQIHELFYGRAHLVFGWVKSENKLAVPWNLLPDYFSSVVEDTFEYFGPGERPLAYVFGWMAHVIGDSLIKNIQHGLDLHLLDGQYTPRNRPIQDLVSFHEIGRKELRLNWTTLFIDLAETPVEPVQFHYMRVGISKGALGKKFTDGWAPEKVNLLRSVLAENRRYLKTNTASILSEMELHQTPEGLDCNENLRKTSGLKYPQMVELAEKANFRHALWKIGEAVADMFSTVVQRQPRLATLSTDIGK
jgi:hypothetical protein